MKTLTNVTHEERQFFFKKYFYKRLFILLFALSLISLALSFSHLVISTNLLFVIIGVGVVLFSLYAAYTRYARKVTKFSRERALDEAEIANKTKKNFLSIIAHDLKNPISAVLGFSEMLSSESEKIDNRNINLYANQINIATKRTHNLLNDLLNWANSTSGRLSVTPSVFYLNPVFENAIALAEMAAQKKEIIIQNNVNKKIRVFADQNMIHTVIINFLSNAVKFTKDGGKVIVSAEYEHSKVKISIYDNGVGISQKVIDNIKNEQHPISTPGTNRESGTGLGLLLSKEFIEKNKGELIIKSEIGAGTTIIVILPREVCI